jgi:hypothetical protein
LAGCHSRYSTGLDFFPDDGVKGLSADKLKKAPDTFIIGLVATLWQIIYAAGLLTGAIDFEIFGRLRYCVVMIMFRVHSLWTVSVTACCSSNQRLPLWYLCMQVDADLMARFLWSHFEMRIFKGL